MAISPPRINYDELIVEDESGFWVNGRVYNDPAVFEDELDKIFTRGWVYVGHESEVSEPGDYRTRWIGKQPVIMTRDEDGQVHLLLNRCRHEGATVCQEEGGNSSYFRCAYHGWTYSNKGDLTGVSFPVGYDNKPPYEKLGLIKVPKVGIHRGFVFGCLNPQGQEFHEYLGRAKDYIDRYCDMSPTGEVEARAGRQGVVVHANWKGQLQNLTDDYHVHITHATGIRRRGRQPGSFTRWNDRPSDMRDLGDGHTILDRFNANRRMGDEVNENVLGSHGVLDQDVIEANARRLGSREQAEWIARSGPPHIMVFPNLMLLWNAFRIIQPLEYNKCYVYYYPLFLKGASDEINERRLRAHENGFGPAGFINPDDGDMQTRQQIGSYARVDEEKFMWLTRGYHEERMEPDEFGVPALTSPMMNETSSRGIWRHYKKVMSQP
ncbi:MAG TPA: aromatic ring-hydroxylating dioxygenase subunit alpha [Dehalococcoidia bacterium]|nr:aromatic ring-hydroxylating dioxygenase subunit alpha [Dehalococcoidia bacterium]